MIGLLREDGEISSRLSAISAMTHGNYLRKTEEYFDFLKECHHAGDKAINQLDTKIDKSSENKVAFLALVTRCLLKSNDIEVLIERYKQKYGERFLVVLELSLSIFLRGLNSPRGGPAHSKVADLKKQLIENARTTLAVAKRKNLESASLPRFVDELFDISLSPSLCAPMNIAIVLDDLNPLKTATLSKMVFDQIAVLLEYTSHNFIVICSRLHAPHNQFWMPGVHQTRLVPLDEYVAHYDIPMEKFRNRLSLLNLNEVFYGDKKCDKIPVNAFITYPFRHGMLEPVLYAKAPVVEIEIMSGISNAKNCDVIIPNGVPSEEFLKTNFSKVQTVTPPRRRFKGGESGGFTYLNGAEKIVVSASKDFDKRSELDIESFLKHVADFLNSHQDYVWLFVGGTKDFEATVASRYATLVTANRLIMVGYEQDLPGLLSLAYLYVHPPLIGGGRAPAIAIENGCPALTFEFGDCTKYMPYVCQRKDFPSMFESIAKVVEDERTRTELMNICLSVIAPTVNIEAALIYESALKRACIKHRGRSPAKAAP